MDYRERSERYLFWRQLIISLIAIGLVYILFIRPIQSFAVREFILPAFDSLIKPDSDIFTGTGWGDDGFYISSLSNSFPSISIEVPFNGYFWLAMSMVWPTKNKRFGRVIWIYNWVLFLILGVLAVREADELLKD